MLVPTIVTPPWALESCEMPVQGYLPNQGETLFVPFPLFIPQFGEFVSVPIAVSGFRSFSFNGEVVLPNSQVISYVQILDPRDHTRVVSTYFLGDHIQQDVKTPTDFGVYGDRGGPVSASGISPQVMRVRLTSNHPNGGTLNSLDGLWCFAT